AEAADHVVAAGAVDDVLAGRADEHVGAGRADEREVAVAAEAGHVRGGRSGRRKREGAGEEECCGELSHGSPGVEGRVRETVRASRTGFLRIDEFKVRRARSMTRIVETPSLVFRLER